MSNSARVPDVRGGSVEPPDQIEQILDLVGEAESVDGFSALNEAALLRLRHDPDLCNLVEDDGDAVLAYGQLTGVTGGASEAALVVHPDERGRGRGTKLLTEMLEISGQRLTIWSPRGTPAAAALAGRTGLVAVRELLTMTRPLLDEVDPVPPPAGIEIRTFRRGVDEESWLAVNARAFAHHPEQGGLTRRDLDQRVAEPWFDPSGFLLATRPDGTVVGFHWTKQHPRSVGEVYVLGVDPEAGVRGLGRALLAAGLQHLRAAGVSEVMLYTEGTNTRAIALYERAGFALTSRDIMYASPSAS